MELRTTSTHVDEWLNLPSSSDQERLAKEWLAYFRARNPGSTTEEMVEFYRRRADWMDTHSLFCTYKGRRYRVTGASRLGDVWLTSDLKKAFGYDLRVDVAECSDWRRETAKADNMAQQFVEFSVLEAMLDGNVEEVNRLLVENMNDVERIRLATAIMRLYQIIIQIDPEEENAQN